VEVSLKFQNSGTLHINLSNIIGDVSTKILEVFDQIGLQDLSKLNYFTSERINFIFNSYSNLTPLLLTQAKQLPVCDVPTAIVEILDRIQIIFTYSERF
jgi:plasmid replication initiation protein